MPIQFPPPNPLPKGPRPGSRTEHKVHNNETLESVARDYGVPLRALLLHNFGTTEPPYINWYLQHHVGCNLPTDDHKNWRFSDSAFPGKIYIPLHKTVLEMDPIDIRVHRPRAEPVDLDLPAFWPRDLSAVKWNYEFEIPEEPKEVGYFLLQLIGEVAGEMKQEHGLAKVELKPKEVKTEIERELNEFLKVKGAFKVNDESFHHIAEAVKKKSKADFAKAVFHSLELEAAIKHNFKITDKFTITPELGFDVVEFFQTPVLFKLEFAYEDVMFFHGSPFKGNIDLKGELHVGLSKKGWTWVIEKVGKPLVREFLVQGGRALSAIAEWLTAEGLLAGAIVGGAVLGTLALASLCAYATLHASEKGKLIGFKSWYVWAYSRKVFGQQQRTQYMEGDDARWRDDMVRLGQRDALIDARAALAKAHDKAMSGTDEQALEAFRHLLIVAHGSRAEDMLRASLEDRARKLVGL